jgi:hypothetical protein
MLEARQLANHLPQAPWEVGQFDVEAALRRHFGEVNSLLHLQIDPLPRLD